MIVDFVFILVSTLYFISAIQIDYWMTIYTLGFKLEVPSAYLIYPQGYDYFKISLFLLAFIFVFFLNHIPIWVGILSLGIFWFLSTRIGQNRAFKKYREISKEMVHQADNLEFKEKARKDSKKTNSELRDELISKINFL